MPKMREFKDYMDKRFGKACSKESGWKGISVKKEVENEIEEEE